jgi:hypothetical protein
MVSLLEIKKINTFGDLYPTYPALQGGSRIKIKLEDLYSAYPALQGGSRR